MYRFLKSSGLLAKLVATDTPAAEEQLQNIARFFEIVRSRAALLVDDRAIFDSDGLVNLKAEQRFDGLRTDPRFAELVRRVGLSQ